MVLGYFIFINMSGYGFKLFFCPFLPFEYRALRCQGRSHQPFYKNVVIQRERGRLLHWSPKFYNNVFLFVGFTFLIGQFIKFSVQTFQLLIFNYRGYNFVSHWGCTSIYRPLSHPFRSFLLFYLERVATEDPTLKKTNPESLFIALYYSSFPLISK